jgi:flagellar biosynthesis regulator FlbT
MDLNELTCRINGAVYEVDKKLGVGFLEKTKSGDSHEIMQFPRVRSKA